MHTFRAILYSFFDSMLVKRVQCISFMLRLYYVHCAVSFFSLVSFSLAQMVFGSDTINTNPSLKSVTHISFQATHTTQLHI